MKVGGKVKSDRLVDPGAPSEKPEIGVARRSGFIQKKLAEAVAEAAAS